MEHTTADRHHAPGQSYEKKSMLAGVALTILFGPPGMLYATPKGALIMILVGILGGVGPLLALVTMFAEGVIDGIMFLATFQFLIMAYGVACVIWVMIAVSEHNRKVRILHRLARRKSPRTLPPHLMPMCPDKPVRTRMLHPATFIGGCAVVIMLWQGIYIEGSEHFTILVQVLFSDVPALLAHGQIGRVVMNMSHFILYVSGLPFAVGVMITAMIGRGRSVMLGMAGFVVMVPFLIAWWRMGRLPVAGAYSTVPLLGVVMLGAGLTMARLEDLLSLFRGRRQQKCV